MGMRYDQLAVLKLAGDSQTPPETPAVPLLSRWACAATNKRSSGSIK